MKKLKIFLTGIIILFLSTAIMAQTDPPPPPGDHGGDDDVPGGGAPIGSGLLVLLGLGAAYGGKKIYNLKQKSE